MGGVCCKTGGSGTPSPLPQDNISSQVKADLRSYKKACKRDPKLQSFDATLHERTNHVIEILADQGVEIRSLGSFKEVTTCLLEMNQDVAKVILESMKDILDNQELFAVVEEYFKNNVKTMEFCTALGSSLKGAQNSQSILQSAIEQFEEEVKMQDGAVEKKFEKTLEGLQKFKEAGDPFTRQFLVLLQSVHGEQKSMLDKLKSRKKQLDKKFKSMKQWRRVSNVLYVSAFVSVLIISVVAAAVAAPAVVTALAGAMAVPIGSVGKWCDSLWNRYEKALKEEKVLVRSIEVGTSLTIKDMESIRLLVNKFQNEIGSLLMNADFPIREADNVEDVIEKIKKKMEVFMETTEVIATHARECNADISKAREAILNKALKNASSEELGYV